MSSLSADQEWENFLNGDTLQDSKNEIIYGNETFIPKVTEIYISTQTKIGHLNQLIDLKTVFWDIPVISYQSACSGVIKKQMKFNSTSPEEVNDIVERKKQYDYIDDYIISQVNNDNGRNKFKDIRKISVGVCKKDITSYRCKEKSAFYNCFVLIVRLCNDGIYKESHVKIFNTGKLELPGIQTEIGLNKCLDKVLEILNNQCKIDYYG